MSERPVKDLSKDPATTVAMGMKQTHVSTECWRDSCRKELRIRDEWVRTFKPELSREEAELVERVRAREEAKREAAHSVPERALLMDGVSKDGKGRIAYLKARRQLTPQERFGLATVTASQEAGWRCLELLPPRPEGIPSYGRKPVIQNGFYRRGLGGSLAVATH
jgi:hypothetical protein